MTRDLTPDVQAALQAVHVRPVFFLELEFVSLTLRYCTGNHDISWNAQTWQANSQILDVNDTLKETTENRAISGSVTFSGNNTNILELALNETQRSKKANIYLGFLNTSTNALIADPTTIFNGKFDSAEISTDGDLSSSVVFHYEHELIQNLRTKELRYTKYCQDSLYPGQGDLGFDFAPAAEDWNGFWGKAARPNFRRKRKAGRN